MGIIAILSLRKKSFRSPAIITYGKLQIHGIASIVEYGTTEYNIGRENYDERFPQYMELFEKADNELYIIKPLIIWNYNPSLGGEMY